MPSRASLHRLIDDLPETEIPRAERVLEALREAAEPLCTLENAPEDDEPETSKEAAAVAEAWREHAEGKGLTTEELKRELGLK
ncbi:MAG TPA: hypothetical protein VKK31_00800 [Thermoanaerobaculia bacterium]|nr:hypothetical protein [Thermoanaerobaculia bacterium]